MEFFNKWLEIKKISLKSIILLWLCGFAFYRRTYIIGIIIYLTEQSSNSLKNIKVEIRTFECKYIVYLFTAKEYRKM